MIIKEFVVMVIFGFGWCLVIYPWLIGGEALSKKITFTILGILIMILVPFLRKWFMSDDDR